MIIMIKITNCTNGADEPVDGGKYFCEGRETLSDALSLSIYVLTLSLSLSLSLLSLSLFLPLVFLSLSLVLPPLSAPSVSYLHCLLFVLVSALASLPRACGEDFSHDPKRSYCPSRLCPRSHAAEACRSQRKEEETYVCVYIYIYRERERDLSLSRSLSLSLSTYLYKEHR